ADPAPADSAGGDAAPAGPPSDGDPGVAYRLVRDAFVDVLGEDPGERPLPDLGLDSLVIADLTSAIERLSGTTVDPSLVMRSRTMADLAARLTDRAVPPGPASGTDPVIRAAGAVPSAPDPGDPVPTASLSALLRPLLATGQQPRH
ncbi:acyl carrier protein, partial [Micromonospora humida]